MKKFLKILFNCLIVLLSMFFLFILIINFSSNNDGIMKFSKYSLFYVEGDSMYPEIKDGDFIAINTNKKSKYDVGEVISFIQEIDDGYIVVTHKIVSVDDSSESYKYVTRGVNNKEIDEKMVRDNQIIGIYSGFRIPLLGYIAKFCSTDIGYLILVVIPLGGVLLMSIYELIKEIDKRKKGEV